MVRWLAPISVALTFAAILAIGFWQAKKHLPSPNELAHLIEAELAKTLNVPVKVESVQLGLTGATVRNLRVQPDHRSPTGYTLTVPQLRLRWSLSQILRPSQWKRVVQEQIERALHQVIIANATLFLWRDQSGIWNIQPFISQQRQVRPAAKIPMLRIQNSTLIVGDETLPLPNGLPFRLKLVNVRATVEPIELGTRITASGQLEPPLGSDNSEADLTIAQIGHEGFSETHGRLVVTNIRISHLPERLQSFAEGRAKFAGGIISSIALDWHQTDSNVRISGTANLQSVPVELNFGKPTKLKPTNASVSFAAHLQNRQVVSWNLTVHLTQPSHEFGHGFFALEGKGKFMRVRWNGENFPVTTLAIFAPESLPIVGGKLSGSAFGELDGKRILVEADLTLSSSQFRPVAGLARLQLPKIKLQRVDAKVRLERVRNRWHGNIALTARSQLGQGKARVWLNGVYGRAEVEVANLKFEPFKAAILNFAPSQIRKLAKISDGFLSGAFSVSWRGQKFQVEKLVANLHQVALESEWSPPVRLSGHFQMDGENLRISSLKVGLDKNALALFGGQVTVSKSPIWQIQGQLPSSAIERLMAWAKAKWNLPVHLLRGGQAQVDALGISNQWQAQILWDEPSGIFVFRGLKWQSQLSRMSLLAASQGASVIVSGFAMKPERGRFSFGKFAWQFLDGVQFSEWRAVWDERKKSLTAYGSVKIPQVEFEGMPVKNFSADLEVTFVATANSEFELLASNLTANLPEGSLVNGHARFSSKGEGELSAQLKLLKFGLKQITKLTNQSNSTLPQIAGQFNGELVINTRLQSSLQLALSGELYDFSLADEKNSVCANRLTLNALGVTARREGEQWRLVQLAGDGLGRNISLSLNDKKLQVELAQVQGLTKRLSDDWHWDLRLHKVRALDGALSGHATGNASCAKADFSFAEIDMKRLSSLFDLKAKNDLPEGKISGWFKLSVQKRDEKWWGDWEGATLLTEGKWQDWSVKMLGIRAHGQLEADEKMNLQRLVGKFDGIHLLSDEGQAVLDGEFAFRNGVNFVALDGKWVGVSLKKLSQRFELPVELAGLAEGTVRVFWNRKLQVNGTVKSNAVAVGEQAIWRNLSCDWVWDGKAVNIKRASADWNGGKLAIDGVVGVAQNLPTNLTIRGDDVSLSDLSLLLREFQFPMSDWSWSGRLDGKIWLGGTNGLLRLAVSLNGQKVRLGLAELGIIGLDINLERTLREGKTLWSAKGIVNLQKNGAVVTAEFDSKNGKWQIRWHGGNLDIDTLKAIVAEWQNRQGKKLAELDRWLKLPLRGNVSGDGYAIVAENRVDEMAANIRVPNLTGVGKFVAQADLKVQRKGKAWTIDLTELRQGGASAVGSVKIDDEGHLSGELAMNQVPSQFVASILALLGVELQTVPEGVLNAKVKLAGTLAEPTIEGTLQANEVHWRGWLVRQIFARKFEIRDGTLKVERGDGVIRWRTDASLASFWGQMELRGDGKINWQVEVPPTSLDAILPPDLPALIQRGWVSGSISLSGKISEPKLKGNLELVADSIDFTPESSLPKSLEPLTLLRNIRCQVEADGKVARLKVFSANWCGGLIEGSGWIELGESGLQNLFANTAELTLKVQNAVANLNGTNLNLKLAELKGELGKKGLKLTVAKLQGNGFDGQGEVSWSKIPSEKWGWLTNGIWNLALRFSDFRWQVKGAKGELSGLLTLRSEGEDQPPTLSGTLTIHDGDVMRLPFVAAEGEGKWQLPPALKLALRAEIGNKFFLRNPQASLMLDGEISLSGDLSQPRIEGELRSQRGTLRLPASVLTITEMSVRVAYAVDPMTKQWVGTARMRVDGETQIDIHRVLFTVTGPVDAQSQKLGILPSVTVMAIPPLPEQKALERMFGLGLAQLGETLTNWQQLFSGTFVQSFMGNLLAPVTEPLAQALRWTELSVIREQTTGRQWLRLGIPLSPRLHVLWRQGFSPADPSALEVQYYLGKRTSVTFIKRERERAEVRVQTSVRF